MNPSAHSSVHTSTNAYSYASTGAYHDAARLYHPPFVPDGRMVLFPMFESQPGLTFMQSLTAEVASISPSGPCTVFPVRVHSPPSGSHDLEPSFLHHPTETTQLRTEPLDGSQLYPYATASPYSTVSPAFEQALSETTTSCISPDLIYPPLHYDRDVEEGFSTATASQPSRAIRRTHHRSPSSSSYPSPSPEPSPRTSSTIFVSQRRNSPARTAAPVVSSTWQCPYCPHVQRNRRSPDLKRHIKTHTRGADVADWVCCGVPVLNAIELGVPAATVREAQVFEFDGTLMIGGCRKAFSRCDALKRHLQREKGKCFGDALSLHQRGNQESADACKTVHHRDMHYLNAVIHETLRLLPPAATSNAATVVLGSVVLPQAPGTCVSVPPYVLHRDARNFVFLDAFWPEQWLVASRVQLPLSRARSPSPRAFSGLPPLSSGSECVAPAPESGGGGVARFQFVHNSVAFIPFSHGPMDCAGKGLAMLEMRAVVCALVQRSRFRIRPGDSETQGGRLTSGDGHGEENKGCYLTANRMELLVVLEERW
ncbi:hypothetical protein V8D89_002863 [Ganoderma adspersum]